MRKAADLQEIVALCLRRGFFFQSADIYGGLQGVYDYGPLGIELKRNLQNAWWKSMVYDRDDVEGLDSSILTLPHILQYSSHEETFADMMVDCKSCKKRMRADHIQNGQCDSCGSKDLTPPRAFNLMMRASFGPVVDNDSYVYLRPETAQGIFINFRNVISTTSRKLPFGIAQIGKAFRNEITPRNFVFRVREFEQMELEFFVQPGTDVEWHSRWVHERYEWWISQGLSRDNLRKDVQHKDDLSHYSKATTDLVYQFPHGWEELEGVANRTDFDLGSHSKSQNELGLSANVMRNEHSNAKLVFTDQIEKKECVPFVIEPSAGVERGLLAIICEAYHVEEINSDDSENSGENSNEQKLPNSIARDAKNERVVLKFKPHLAPFKVAIAPLARNNQQIVSLAKEIYSDIKKIGIGRVRYEDTGNVGKAYRRNDEIGTPICITVDFESIEGDGQSVTVRDRDTMKQKRILRNELCDYIRSIFVG